LLQGLDVENALQFWISHFSKIMTTEQFTKDYSYSFKHMYGKEGARKDYTPFSCVKIILGSPPLPGTFHGCPFK
jgi:DNA primase large subunit